jgi:hypothetical protein
LNLNRLARSTFLIFVSASLIACTSMEVISTKSMPDNGVRVETPITNTIVPGDVLEIRLRNGSTFQFTVSKVFPAELEGVRTHSPETVVIKAQDVEAIERKQLDALKTTLLVLAIGTVAYYIASTLAAAQILATTP